MVPGPPAEENTHVGFLSASTTVVRFIAEPPSSIDREEPIRLDPYLVQLRVDAQASTRQTENTRLTVVQDLTWALINSPGFLFNH